MRLLYIKNIYQIYEPKVERKSYRCLFTFPNSKVVSVSSRTKVKKDFFLRVALLIFLTIKSSSQSYFYRFEEYEYSV